MAESNTNARLEAFCDGVFAIAITLLIIDIKIPSKENIFSTYDLWLSLKNIFPSIFAFLLSFIIIFITWTNHHRTLKLVDKTSSQFIYANGFMLLTVVIFPFPTALLGQYLLTDFASPAVVLYTSVDALQAVGWILLCNTALKPHQLLTKNEKSTIAMRRNLRNGYFALMFYTVFAIIAFWFPLTIAILISLTWIFWLILSINLKEK